MSAPIGNQNAKKARLWLEALRRALARKANGDLNAGLDELADKLIRLADAGEQWALLELGNRLDGKPAQAVTVAGDDDGGPVQHSHTVEFVNGPHSVTPET